MILQGIAWNNFNLVTVQIFHLIILVVGKIFKTICQQALSSVFPWMGLTLVCASDQNVEYSNTWTRHLTLNRSGVLYNDRALWPKTPSKDGKEIKIIIHLIIASNTILSIIINGWKKSCFAYMHRENPICCQRVWVSNKLKLLVGV